jgi:hypothetical protein
MSYRILLVGAAWYSLHARAAAGSNPSRGFARLASEVAAAVGVHLPAVGVHLLASAPASRQPPGGSSSGQDSGPIPRGGNAARSAPYQARPRASQTIQPKGWERHRDPG